jgi:predicted transcriptional regulator of viral defense system
VAVSTRTRLIQVAEAGGVIRARDLDRHRIPRVYLTRLVSDGALRRLGRGLYISSNAKLTEHHELAEAAKRVPRAVVCLLSALQFHGLTTQAPREVWIAIGQKARRARGERPRLRIVHFSGQALSAGVEQHVIEGVRVRIYNPAKTVADCFKFRNKIGLDVALEALRDYRRTKKGTSDDLWHFAKICRVANVMRPYLEAIG